MPAGNEMKKKKNKNNNNNIINNNNNNDNECGEAVKVWQVGWRGRTKIGVFRCVSHETDPNPFCCAITKWARPM